MEIEFSEWVAVTDASSVGEARRTAMTAAGRLELDVTQSGQLALLATEAARNVLVHGGGGEVILAGTSRADAPLARIVAMDRGAGIANIADAMSDGFSTAGTPGGGMGAMKRIASRFEIFTGGNGTIVLIELGNGDARYGLLIAGMAVPCPGETISGDGIYSLQTSERTLLFITDGLGHGFGAAEAAHEAIAAFRKWAHLTPTEILSYVHDALRKTRGAVAGIAEIRPREKSLVFAGVGNISGVVLSEGRSRSLVSHSGTLGLTAPRIQEFRSEWPADGVLVLHSDGLQSKWDLSPYPGLLSRHPALIGGALLRDFRRQRDDASVIVVRAA
ncbi:MAG: SpoIIE family protein phosphatase [Terracidiphilus sp.]